MLRCRYWNFKAACRRFSSWPPRGAGSFRRGPIIELALSLGNIKAKLFFNKDGDFIYKSFGTNKKDPTTCLDLLISSLISSYLIYRSNSTCLYSANLLGEPVPSPKFTTRLLLPVNFPWRHLNSWWPIYPNTQDGGLRSLDLRYPAAIVPFWAGKSWFDLDAVRQRHRWSRESSSGSGDDHNEIDSAARRSRPAGSNYLSGFIGSSWSLGTCKDDHSDLSYLINMKAHNRSTHRLQFRPYLAPSRPLPRFMDLPWSVPRRF
jgi:hypothetical protein